MTKTEFVVALLAKNPSLSKADIGRLVESMTDVVLDSLKADGTALIPGICKLKVSIKAATKERQGINPFNKQPVTIPAKPAMKKVRASVLKPLKDAIV
jgi:nucleoid DNA-binding protein